LKNNFKIIDYLTYNEKKGFILLTVLFIASSILEVISISSVFPVMNYLFIGETPEFLDEYIVNIGKDKLSILIFFSYAVLYISAGLSKIFILRYQFNYIYNLEANLSLKIFERYIKSEYRSVANVSESFVTKLALSEINNFIQVFLLPIVNLISNGLFVIFILLSLFYINFKATLIVCLMIFSMYAIIYMLFRSKLSILSTERLHANESRFKYIGDSISNLRSVKVNNLEELICDNYKNVSKKFSKATSKASFINAAPKNIIEIYSFLVIIGFLFYFMIMGMEVSNIIPQIVLFSVAGLKILPGAQKIYSSLAHLKFSFASVRHIHDSSSSINTEEKYKTDRRKAFYDTFLVENISYSYDGKIDVISNINFKLKKGESLAVVGSSGSGKSTLIDCLLLLYKPRTGSIKIDGNPIISDKDISEYRNIIGYVAQNIKLFNNTVLWNIVLSNHYSNEIYKHVKASLEAVELWDKVSTLQSGMLTEVGGGESIFSGGELQRLNIARAIYRNPEILLLDEATSALDEKLERKIIENIKMKNITTIHVTHRKNVIKTCDSFIEIKSGVRPKK
jgi:ATP-binding cassette, subfamily B, bacterial PglK